MAAAKRAYKEGKLTGLKPFDSVDGPKKRRASRTSKDTIIGRKDPLKLTGKSGLFVLQKYLDLPFETVEWKDDDWKVTSFKMNFYNDPLEDPNFLMMIAMQFSPKEIQKKFRKPKIELLRAVITFPETNYFHDYESDMSANWVQYYASIIDAKVEPDVEVVKTPQNVFPSYNPITDSEYLDYIRFEEGTQKILEARFMEAAYWPGNASNSGEMKMKATLTGEITAPEAEITFPEGNLSGDIVNEGALAGVIGIQEVGVDVTVNSTGDKVISFADPGALKFSGPFVAELEMEPPGNISWELPNAASGIPMFYRKGKQIQEFKFSDGAGHGLLLENLSLVLNTLMVGEMQGASKYGLTPLGKVQFVYRVHYVDLLEEEINELIERQNTQRLNVL